VTPPWEVVEKLHAEHDISSMICGRPSVDEWLQTKARSNAHNVATHVCLDIQGDVVGFFALKTVIVGTEGLSSKLRSGSNEGQSIGILLCQMGLAERVQDQKHGRPLFKHAMAEAVAAHRISPVQLFLVDAADEGLVGFYNVPGMTHIPNTLRLMAPMNALAKAIPPAM
jgi:hypothetical protein